MINELVPEHVHVNDLPGSQSFPIKENVSRLGGFSVHGYSWLYENSELVVTGFLTPETDAQLCRFNFGRLLNDRNLIITSVAEFRDPDCKRTKFKLIVSLSRENGVGENSFLLLVHVQSQKMIKCIECPFRIVCIEPIATGQIESDQLPFSNQLQQCNGLVALGTATGVVYFLDLQLEIMSKEPNPNSPTKVKIMTSELIQQTGFDPSSKRTLAHGRDELVCIPLNMESQYKGHFAYQVSQGEYETFSLDQVEITALKYFFQTNTLYIGFSFGGFQGWSLQTMKIVFGCQLETCLEPVIGFSLQEPENDPRNYCYLWVLRGYNSETISEYKDPIYSNASLYVFEYGHKEWINNYGYLHSGLISEGIRFEYYMTATPYSANADAGSGGGGSSLISYGTIQKGSLQAYRAAEEESGFYDTSLFYFVWEAFDTQFESSVRYLAIFDLNQWYQSQMPHIINVESASSFSPYICFYKLSKITSCVFNNSFLDVLFDSKSLQRYEGKNFQNDIIYYPCSLSFEMRFLTQDKLVHASFYGLQNNCLSLLRQDAQDVLIEPVEFLNRCFFTGILASDLTSQLNTLEKRREAVLTLALENDELPVLLQIVENWATGEYDDAGCSCKTFLSWLWNQVIRIKESIDLLIVPIFDESAEAFDNSTVVTLRAYQHHLKCLQVLLKSLTNCGAPNTEQGEKELFLRHEIVQFILDYLSVIIWLYHSELLQVNNDLDINWTEVYGRLNAKYESKRKEAKEKDPTINPTDVLLIDGLVKHVQPVTEMWREHGSSGFYPPPNLHSMVSVYLVDSLSLEMKNQFMLYYLYDLVSIMSEMNIHILEKTETFPLYFGLQSDLTKLVEAMFALDHDQVEMAIGILQKPSLQLTYPNEVDDHKSLNDELQVRIVRQLLSKGYTMNAFRFMSSSLFSCDNLTKQKFYIKTLMRSQNIRAAFEFQKKHRNQTNGEQLLYQFYFDCEELKLFDKLFMFTLDQIEEESLICYLMEISKSYKSKLLLIIYFIISEKPFDSARILQNIESEIQHIPDEELYSNADELIKLVQAYQKVSPPTLVQLSEIIGQLRNHQNKQQPSTNIQTRRMLANKKNPEAVQVEEKRSQTSVSVFVSQLLKKIELIEKHDEKRGLQTPFTKRIEKHGLLVSQDSPFLRRRSSCLDTNQTTPVLRNSQFASYKRDSNAHSFSENRTESSTAFTAVKEIDKTVNGAFQKSTNVGRSTQDNYPTNLLKVLHTPNIKSRTRSFRSDPNACPTPASILKVRTGTTDKRSEQLRFDLDEGDSLILNKSPYKIDTKFELESSISTETDEIHNYPDRTDLQENDMSVEGSQANDDEFVFSTTDEIRMGNETAETTAIDLTPTKSATYVFSPPLTRSRKKKVNSKSKKKDVASKMETTFDETFNTASLTTATNEPTTLAVEEKKSNRKTPKRSSTKASAASVETPSYSTRSRK